MSVHLGIPRKIKSDSGTGIEAFTDNPGKNERKSQMGYE